MLFVYVTYEHTRRILDRITWLVKLPTAMSSLLLRGLFEERENGMPNRVMRKIALIVALSFLLSIPNVSYAQQQASAGIKVDIDRQIGVVGPHLFGNFSDDRGA